MSFSCRSLPWPRRKRTRPARAKMRRGRRRRRGQHATVPRGGRSPPAAGKSQREADSSRRGPSVIVSITFTVIVIIIISSVIAVRPSLAARSMQRVQMVVWLAREGRTLE